MSTRRFWEPQNIWNPTNSKSKSESGTAAAASIDPDSRDDRVDDLRIAVSEAVTNAVESHNLAGTDSRIEIRCVTDDSSVEVNGDETVEYDGEMHTAANLHEALKEGYYGKF